MAWLPTLRRTHKADAAAPAKSPPTVAYPSDPEMRFLDLVGEVGDIRNAPVEELMRRVEPLVARLYHEIGWDRAEFDRLFRPLLARYAGYVHLLPASESHHHARFGGLLIHGIEVATEAARLCRESVRDLSRAFLRDIELRAARKRLWPAAAACGGLLHDLGKVLVDQIVSSADTQDTWNPYQQPLDDWLRTTGVRTYTTVWKAGRRHKRHEPFGLVLTWPLIGSELLSLLNHHGRDLFEGMLLGALEDDSDPLGLGPIIRDADMASVRHDRDSQRKRWREGAVGGHPLVNRFLEGCQGLMQEGAWQVNAVGSPLWLSEDGLFVVWNIAMAHVLGWLRENSSQGSIPNDLDAMADFLIDAKLARPRVFSDGSLSNTWEITLPAPTGFMGGMVSQALLITDPNVILAGRSVPAPMVISVAPDPTAVEIVVEPEDAPAEPAPAPIRGTKTIEPSAQAQHLLPLPAVEKAAAASVPRRPRPTSEAASRREPDILPADARAYFDGMGVLGEALIGLLVDYARNPDAFTDLLCYRERKLVMRWPSALAGYTASASEVMQYLKTNTGVLATSFKGAGIDPMRGSVVIQAVIKEGKPTWPSVIFNEDFSRYALALGDPRPARDHQARVDFSRWLVSQAGTVDPERTAFDSLVLTYARHSKRTPEAVRAILVQPPSLLANPDAETPDLRIDMAMVAALIADSPTPSAGAGT